LFGLIADPANDPANDLASDLAFGRVLWLFGELNSSSDYYFCRVQWLARHSDRPPAAVSVENNI
jgi:hypothetical protein